MCPQEQEDNKAKLRPALYVRTNAGKKIYNIKFYNINLFGQKIYFYIKIIFSGCVKGGITGRALAVI
jgi:hypothetical protein